jgi:large subunit ribosomal protein L10
LYGLKIKLLHVKADKFASSHKDTFAIKTGIVEGKVADVATINALAKLPGREELLGMLLLHGWHQLQTSLLVLMLLESKKKNQHNYML